ncbi:MAG: EamA family transporter, partial [Coleofasciculaceae cyanobacterium SM2_3_26]|nr:EamA family transporter [Coleofasciculaceae cyanobacterium SM2_3_26]
MVSSTFLNPFFQILSVIQILSVNHFTREYLSSMQANLSQPWLSWRSLLLIAPFFLWGTAMVAMKGVMADTTPLFVAGFRLVPAGVLVLVVAAFFGQGTASDLASLAVDRSVCLGGRGTVPGIFGGRVGENRGGLGSVMIDSQPIAVAILSRLLYGR